MSTAVDLRDLELNIGDAAHLLRCSPSLLRKYEKAGLTPPPPRDHAGRRVYRLTDVEEIARFRAARQQPAREAV